MLLSRQALLAVVAGAFFLVSGAALAMPVDNPLFRSLYWFRFAGGKDVREACGQGTREYYRLIYNGIYREQVRAYDFIPNRDGTATLVSRVFGEAVLNAVEISELNDLLGPWRGQKAERTLTAAEAGELRQSILASGLLNPPPAGLVLPSNDFYWVVAACVEGQWRYTGYHHPTDGFRAVRFDKVLFRLDTTGVPVNPPRALEPSRFRGNPNETWRLTIGRDRIEY